jgi:hypothetical protein
MSDRTGSYFGMTVRIDDYICCDTANLYHLLDLLFKKFILGRILTELQGGGYKYQYDSFKSCDSILRDVEQKFYTDFNFMFVEQLDLVQIPNSYTNRSNILKLKRNIIDVTSTESKDTLLSGHKLLISPQILSDMAEKIQRTSESQIQEVRQECNRQLQQKSKEYDDYVASASSDKAQLKKEIDRLQKSLNTMENELNRIRNENKRQKLDSEINQIAKDLKDPINKLSAIMSERFNDAASESDNPRQIRKGNKAKFTAIAVGVLFGLLFGVIIMQNKYIGHYQDTIAQFEDSISNLTKRFGIPAKHQQEDIGDTLSSMDNYTPSTISQSQKASTPRIDIINAIKMEHGKNYQFQILGGDYPQDGKWYVNKQLQAGNAYTVNEAAGTNLVIEYKTSDGSFLVSRSVTVE